MKDEAEIYAEKLDETGFIRARGMNYLDYLAALQSELVPNQVSV